MLKIVAIPAFKDNYIWALCNKKTNKVAIIDPGIDKPVTEFLNQFSLSLSCILVTHHHHDHTGGISALLTNYNVPVYGPNSEKIPAITHRLADDDKIFIEDINIHFTTIEVPGHTFDHIAFFAQNLLFCGDTLFTGGCGKLFEGTATEMYQSLTKLASLPEHTLVYCAHEYTLNNLLFAQEVEPDNLQIRQRIDNVRRMLMQHQPTVPSTLLIEKQTNPFLRCHFESVKKAAQQYANKILNGSVEVFAEIRKWKNNFVLT